MKRTNPFSWLLLLALCACFALPAAAQTDTDPFGALILREGLPSDLPKGFVRAAQEELRNLRHVVIPTGSESHYVVYYGGEAIEGGHPFQRVWHLRPDSTGTLTSVSFEENEEGFLAAAFELYTDVSETAVMSLELRLLPESDVLLFRWAEAGNRSTGGVATAIAIDRPVVVGAPLPDFTVDRLEGGTLSLSNLQGHHLVINTWAISCAPCIAEMPGLNQLVEKYGEQNFVFLALGYDPQGDTDDFLKTHAFKYEQALYNERISELFEEAFPRNVIVNADGIVVYDRTGADAEQYKQLDQAIQEKILGHD